MCSVVKFFVFSNMSKRLSILLSVVAVVSCAAFITACSENDLVDNSQKISNPPEIEMRPLTVPTGLVVDDFVLFWNAVENASGYEIKLSSENRFSDPITVVSTSYSTKSTTFSLLSVVPGSASIQYTVSVKAVGQSFGKIQYLDSDYCESIPFLFLIEAGLYRVTSVGFNGYDFSTVDRDLSRDSYKRMLIDKTKDTMHLPYPEIDFNNLESLKLLFGDELDFSNINTADEFWVALISTLFSDSEIDDLVQNLIFQLGVKVDIQIRVSNYIPPSISYFKYGLSTFDLAFTLGSRFSLHLGGVIVLSNPTLLGLDGASLKYSNRTITVTQELYDGTVFTITYTHV